MYSCQQQCTNKFTNTSLPHTSAKNVTFASQKNAITHSKWHVTVKHGCHICHGIYILVFMHKQARTSAYIERGTLFPAKSLYSSNTCTDYTKFNSSINHSIPIS